MRLILQDEATAAQRQVYFHLVDVTDGITAETGEAGGQPQISTDGAAWTNTGIGTLSAIGNGRYYAVLTTGAVGTAGNVIETRYKSANTAECPGDTALIVAFDPFDSADLGLSNLAALTTDRTARLDLIGSAAVTVVSPVALNGDISIVKGDSYYNADGRAITWTDSTNSWPTISSATSTPITFTATNPTATSDALSVTCTAVNAGTTQQGVRMDLGTTDTDGLTVGSPAYPLAVKAVLASTSSVATLVSGEMTVSS